MLEPAIADTHDPVRLESSPYAELRSSALRFIFMKQTWKGDI